MTLGGWMAHLRKTTLEAVTLPMARPGIARNPVRSVARFGPRSASRRSALAWMLGLLLTASLPACLPESTPTSQDRGFETLGLDVDGALAVELDHKPQIAFNRQLSQFPFADKALEIQAGPTQDNVPYVSTPIGRQKALQIEPRHTSGWRPDSDHRLKVRGGRAVDLLAVLDVNGRVPRRAYEAHYHTSWEGMPDATPPAVLTPEYNIVHSLSEISLVFSEQVDPMRVTGDAFHLENRFNERIRGRFELRFDRQPDAVYRLVFIPQREIESPDTYTLTINADLGDRAGNRLDAALRYTFDVIPSAEELAFDVDVDDVYAEGVDLVDGDSLVSGDRIGRAVRVSSSDSIPTTSRAELGSSTWGTAPTMTQMLYPAAQVGAAGDIVRVFFAVEEWPVAPAFFRHAEIRVWQTERETLERAFIENRPADREIEATYFDFLTVPADGPDGLFSVTLRVPLEYDGQSNIVVEVLHFGGATEIRSSGLYNGPRITRISGSHEDTEAPIFEEAVDAIRFGIRRDDRFFQWERFVDIGTIGTSPGRPLLISDDNTSGDLFLGDLVQIEYEATTQIRSDGRAAGRTSGFSADLDGLFDGPEDYRYLRLRVYPLLDSIGGEPFTMSSRILVPFE